MLADTEPELLVAAMLPPVSRHRWRALVDGMMGKGLIDPSPEELDKRFDKVITWTYAGRPIEPLCARGLAPAMA